MISEFAWAEEVTRILEQLIFECLDGFSIGRMLLFNLKHENKVMNYCWPKQNTGIKLIHKVNAFGVISQKNHNQTRGELKATQGLSRSIVYRAV